LFAVPDMVTSTSEEESGYEKWMSSLRTGRYNSAKRFFLVPAMTIHWHL